MPRSLAKRPPKTIVGSRCEALGIGILLVALAFDFLSLGFGSAIMSTEREESLMRLTRGEKFALWCLLLVAIGFLPPVTSWAAAVDGRVLGLPFLLFWNASMVVATSVLMSLAVFIKNRVDRP